MLRNVNEFVRRNTFVRFRHEPLNDFQEESPIQRVLSRVTEFYKCFIANCQRLKLKYLRLRDRMSSWSHHRYDTGLASLDDLAANSETLDFKTTKIRYVVCHPTDNQRCLLTCNDVALVYQDMCLKPHYLISPKQRNISCAAFRPWDGTHLAVGGEGGICVWSISRAGVKSMVWYDYREEEFIYDLQWLQGGSLLGSASLGNQRIQIWHPALRLVLQELYMPVSGTNYWALRHPLDLMYLIYYIRERSSLYGYRNNMDVMSNNLVKRMPLQTAAWTAKGNHLLYVLKDSSKVMGASSTKDVGLFKQENKVWSSREVIDLDRFFCNWHQCVGGPIQSMAMDPVHVYVTFTFTNQSFILLCVLHIPFNCCIKLHPLQIINSPVPGLCGRPSCHTFGNARLSGENIERSLVICWSSSHLQIEELTAQTREDALLFEEHEIPFKHDIYQIGKN
ncbi:aladin [Drosophila mojavensis]|uniref:Uncharacterized protein n=1 Tax=Drosophila mojavensis TaxID=7230 RepID=B4L6B4_DROMO|nr:aladin [Drosophila mojavensis]EDW05910.1 uncharacterized protein Dmoj_GI16209 [Drosophila mojavensis]